MSTRRLLTVFGMLLAVASTAQLAQAQDGATKVGFVNISTVTSQMKESKDLMARAQERGTSLQNQLDAKKAELNAISEARKQFKPDSQAFADKNNELNRKGIEMEVWFRTNQADLQRENKQALKTIYEKIKIAVAEVAQKRGIDLVVSDDMQEIAQGNIENPQVQPEAVRQMLAQHHVLFASPKSDLTNDVIASLDKNYQAPPAAGAGTTPAPAGK